MYRSFVILGLTIFLQAPALRAEAETISINISDLGGFQFNGVGGISETAESRLAQSILLASVTPSTSE
jgi:hypothetical protein